MEKLDLFLKVYKLYYSPEQNKKDHELSVEIFGIIC